MLVAVAVVGVRDLLALRGALTRARQAAAAARSALADADLDRAATALDAAAAAVAAARTHSDGPLWWAAARLPVLGRSVTVAHRVTDLADAVVAAGRTAVVHGEGVLGPGGTIAVSGTGTGVDLTPFDRAEALLAALDTAPLEAAYQAVAATPPTWLPGPVRAVRREALELGAEALSTIGRARDIVTAVPAFLGRDGPRRYFLMLQNPAELRGTGGFMGFFATLDVEDGRFLLHEPEVVGEITPYGDHSEWAPVADVPADFVARYLHVAAAGFPPNMNVDPDLPTVARVIVAYAAERRGLALDGVIAVDPVALDLLLAPIGPVEVDPSVLDPAGRLPERVAPGHIARTTTIDAYEAFDTDTQGRKAYLRAVGVAAFQRLFSSDWDAAAMGRAVAEAVRGRHLQLYSTRPEEQAAWLRLRAAGALRPAADGDDLLAVVANNAAANKQDVWVGHRLVGRTELGPPRPAPEGAALSPSRPAQDGVALGTRRPVQDGTALGPPRPVPEGAAASGAPQGTAGPQASRSPLGVDPLPGDVPAGEPLVAERRIEVTVEVHNPLPPCCHAEQIIGSAPPAVSRPTGYDRFDALNRTWFTVWVPEGTEANGAWDLDGTPVGIGAGSLHGHRAFDRFVETPAESVGGFRLELDGTATVRRVGGDLLYRWTLWHQGKAIPDAVDWRIVAPPGWSVAEVEVSGGGDGRGLGVFGDGPPLRATIEDGEVHLEGNISADATVEVRFSKPTWRRIWDWLRSPL